MSERKQLSRIDKLFLLISNGTNTLTRSIAAENISEYIKLYPDTIDSIFLRILPLLQSDKWDTRIAAAKTLDFICKNNKNWNPFNNGEYETFLNFETFDLVKILKNGVPLEKHGKEEFNIDWSKIDPKKQIALQRQILKKNLGMEEFSIVEKDISFNYIKDEDLIVSQSQEITPTESLSIESALGVRNAARQKILRKEAAKTNISDLYKDISPLLLLQSSLFDKNWYIRHGACLAFRSIGKLLGNEKNDIILRMICILALDKINDSEADMSVAPIRETCAQTLSYLLLDASNEIINNCVTYLTAMTNYTPDWNVRYSGFLGLKYLFATNNKIAQDFSQIVPSMLSGLSDKIDDIRYVVAECLIALTDSLFIIFQSPNQFNNLLSGLWNCLETMDDLSASTNNVMKLLMFIYTTNNLLLQNSTSVLVNEDIYFTRLFPFLNHPTSSVKQTTLFTLEALLFKSDFKDNSSLLPKLMLLIFQMALIESNDLLLLAIFKCMHLPRILFNLSVWHQFIDSFPIQANLFYNVHLNNCFNLIGTPNLRTFSGLVVFSSDSKCSSLSSNVVSSFSTRIKGCRLLAYLVKNLNDMSSFVDLLNHMLNSDWFSVRETAACLIVEMTASIDRSISPYLGLSILTPVFQKNEVFNKLESDLLLNLDASHIKTPIAFFLETRHSINQIKSNFDSLMSSFKPLLSSSTIELPKFELFPLKFPKISIFKYPSEVITHMVDVDHISNFIIKHFDSLNELALGNTQKKLSIKELAELKIVVEQRFRWRDSLITDIQNIKKSFTTLWDTHTSNISQALICFDMVPSKINVILQTLMLSIKTQEDINLQQRAAFCAARFIFSTCEVPRQPNPAAKLLKNIFLYLFIFFSEKEKLDPDQKLPDNKSLEICHRGAVFVLQNVCHFLKTCLWSSAIGTTLIPEFTSKLLSCSSFGTFPLPKDVDVQINKHTNEKEFNKALYRELKLIDTLIPALHIDMYHDVLNLIDVIISCLSHPDATVRTMASNAIISLSKRNFVFIVEKIVYCVIPLINSVDEFAREGCMECIYMLISTYDVTICPYLIFFIIACINCLSDSNPSVRKFSSSSFSIAIKLVPLERNSKIPEGMNPELLKQRLEKREFFEQLLDGSKISDYVLPVKLSYELRPYQKEGLNWLAFLCKFNLHGALCDDMGLGKTYQTICLIVGETFYRRKDPLKIKLPSLVVCPPTLIGNWKSEVEKFCQNNEITAVQYFGSSNERSKVKELIVNDNVVITSYDILRREIDFFKDIQFNFVILDEGHCIRNSKAQDTIAVKKLRSFHRYLLSGTPIQNNVLELWSLFDFLMPGYLGTESEFNTTIGQPIKLSHKENSTVFQQEQGVLALEKLHKQVLPFILRRTKDQVLNDLPPKTIMDYFCYLTPLQEFLYQRFLNTSSISDSLDASATSFNSFQYLRKLCSHPSLVIDKSNSDYPDVNNYINRYEFDLNSYLVSSKLVALKELLETSCGINAAYNEDQTTGPQHRVLIFAQLKNTLDIIENILFKPHMPFLSFLRLDGDVEVTKRGSVVDKFNSDMSIDVLLLTTHIGGLGLNLTTADTVIFIEHDWNPMKDLQATDRAHRIGQKNSVNVFRLILKDTVEEKIMGIQNFKKFVANAVVNSDNYSLQTMNSGQVVDLLDDSATIATESISKKVKSTDDSSLITSTVAESDNIAEYQKEYDLRLFMSNLSSSE